MGWTTEIDGPFDAVAYKPPLGSTQPPAQSAPGFYPLGKRKRCEANQPPASNTHTEDKNTWMCA